MNLPNSSVKPAADDQAGITITFDGVTIDSTEAVDAANARIDRVQARNRAYLKSLTPEETSRLVIALYARVGARIKLPRPRGAGRPAVRRSAQRSSAKSGDSGDDPEQPPPPPVRGQQLQLFDAPRIGGRR